MSSQIILERDERAVFGLRSLYSGYGYSQYKMGKFEEYDLYVRNKSFLVSDHIITFTDMGGKLMALKPDVTLSIVKNSRDLPGKVQKVYYDENVYRVPRGGLSFREIMQVGLECIGDIDTYCIAEVLTLAAKSLAILSDEYVLDVSHLGVVSALIDRMGVSEAARGRILQCVGEKNPHGIDGILEEESVDVAVAEPLKRLMAADGDCDRTLAMLEAEKCGEAAKALSDVLGAVRAVLPEGKIRIDFSVVNDMNYYNGIVFKGFVNGIPTSILSGGQYDNLMLKMGKKSGAIGFAVYMDLLEELDSEAAEFDTDVVLLYTDNDDVTAVSRAVNELVKAGQRVIARKTVPTKLKYKKLMQLIDGEVKTLEAHA